MLSPPSTPPLRVVTAEVPPHPLRDALKPALTGALLGALSASALVVPVLLANVPNLLRWYRPSWYLWGGVVVYLATLLGLLAGGVGGIVQGRRRRLGLQPSRFTCQARWGGSAGGLLGAYLGLIVMMALGNAWGGTKLPSRVALMAVELSVACGLALGAWLGARADPLPERHTASTAQEGLWQLPGLSRLEVVTSLVHAAALCWLPLGVVFLAGLDGLAEQLLAAALPRSPGPAWTRLMCAASLWGLTVLALLGQAGRSLPRERLQDAQTVALAISAGVTALAWPLFGFALLT